VNDNDLPSRPAIRLPITTAPDIYFYGLEKALSKCCVPLEDARPGDCVALVLRSMVTDQEDTFTDPIVSFVVADDASCQSYRNVNFVDAEQQALERVGPGAILAQAIGLNESILWDKIDRFDTNRIRCLIAPNFVLAVDDRYQSRIQRSHNGGYVIDQHFIEKKYALILPQAVETAHERIDLSSLTNQITALANSFFPVREQFPSGETMPLAPPDLTTIPVAHN
jgi:hypothetical protein